MAMVKSDSLIWDGNVLPSPAYQYKEGKVGYYVFFLDDHPNRDEIIKTKFSAIDYHKTIYKIIVEKEMYDLTPEYFSKEVLMADFAYYTCVEKEIRSRMLFVSIALAIASILITSLVFNLDTIFSSLVSLFVALAYMFLFTQKLVKKVIEKHKNIHRKKLDDLFGKKRVDEILDLQDALIKRRRAEVSDSSSEVQNKVSEDNKIISEDNALLNSNEGAETIKESKNEETDVIKEVQKEEITQEELSGDE